MTEPLKGTCLAAPILLLGPAHSGKSELGVQFLAPDQPAIVVGTGQTSGGRQRRLTALKNLRPPHWESIDCSTDLPAAVAEASARTQQILIDSVSQWLAALTVAGDSLSEDMLEEDLRSRADDLFRVVSAASMKTRIVVISAEVGAAPAPLRAPERLYRRAVGLLNQRLAALSQTVIAVHAGIPLRIKG